MSSLAIVGSLAIDDIKIGDKIVIGQFGGSGGYSAIAASFFTDVNLYSTIGTDCPEKFMNILNSRNINLKYVKLVNGKTPYFFIEYDSEGVNTKYHRADMNVLSEGIITDNINDSKYVYISANDPELQLNIIEKISSSQVVATDTNSIWIKTKRNLVEKIIKNVDIMFMNDIEAREFTGKNDLKACGREILSLGISHLIIKKGQYGAILFSDNKMYPSIAYDTYDMKIIDPTGCGDVVAGGFMGMLAENNEKIDKLNNIYFKALVFGLTLASFKIMDFSVNKLLSVTVDDVWRRYDRFRDLVRL